MAGLTKKYTKDELTIIWKPNVCIHSTICFKGLPGVFNPSNRPWVNLDAANIEDIKVQVDNCPSGALSYVLDANKDQNGEKMDNRNKIEVTDNGPILIKGPVTIKYNDQEDIKDSKTIALCRCGFSSNKPYCDGSHKKEGFKG